MTLTILKIHSLKLFTFKQLIIIGSFLDFPFISLSTDLWNIWSFRIIQFIISKIIILSKMLSFYDKKSIPYVKPGYNFHELQHMQPIFKKTNNYYYISASVFRHLAGSSVFQNHSAVQKFPFNSVSGTTLSHKPIQLETYIRIQPPCFSYSFYKISFV